MYDTVTVKVRSGVAFMAANSRSMAIWMRPGCLEPRPLMVYVLPELV